MGGRILAIFVTVIALWLNSYVVMLSQFPRL